MLSLKRSSVHEARRAVDRARAQAKPEIIDTFRITDEEAQSPRPLQYSAGADPQEAVT
jgi:hypothetical protein